MSSILPQINQLSQVHIIHEQYAQAALKLIVEKLLSMDEFDIGTFTQGTDSGSKIAFDGDDFENTEIELCYIYSKFILSIRAHCTEFNISSFTYTILEESPLYLMIPEKLRNAMEDVADIEEEVIFKPQHQIP